MRYWIEHGQGLHLVSVRDKAQVFLRYPPSTQIWIRTLRSLLVSVLVFSHETTSCKDLILYEDFTALRSYAYLSLY